MTDHFAILGQPRRPWLEAETLKDAFHRRSATLHPDVPGTGDAARFAALNQAFNVLREPASRLRHLLALIAPGSLLASALPAELADLCMRFDASRLREARTLAARRDAASSPLARALITKDIAEVCAPYKAALAEGERLYAAVLAQLKTHDATWRDDDPEQIAALAALQPRFFYLTRLIANIRETLFTLDG